MLEQLREYIDNGAWSQARMLADRLLCAGENSEIFWILNATLYQAEGIRQAEYKCIVRGLMKNPKSYELYYMLGNYYSETNADQAFLCYQQALFYCDNEDKDFLKAELELFTENNKINVQPVSIVILSYNIKDILIGCVESIRANNPKEAYELVIVDNASTDGVVDWLKQQDDIVLLCNDTNMGFAGGCNQGIDIASPYNDIFLLNNDTIVPANALFWLRMALYERKTVGAAGPITNYATNEQMVINDFNNPSEWLEWAKEINIPMDYPYENKVWLVGFAMLIKREALNAVGKLDVRYEWGNFEDNDYGMALTSAGYELLLCYNSFIYHYGSLNMAKDKQKYARYIEMNRNKFIDKWKFDVTKYSFARVDLIGKIKKERMEKFSVLHINCGVGATLARIKHYYPNVETYGVEADEQVIKYGRYTADCMCRDIGEIKENVRFDYIIIEGQNVDVNCLSKHLNTNGEIIGKEKRDV